MRDTDLLKSAISDINRLSLTGAVNWEAAAEAIKKIYAVIRTLSAQREESDRAEMEALEKKRKERQEQLKAAAERGEEIIGGETIRIKADGTREIIAE